MCMTGWKSWGNHRPRNNPHKWLPGVVAHIPQLHNPSTSKFRGLCFALFPRASPWGNAPAANCGHCLKSLPVSGCLASSLYSLYQPFPVLFPPPPPPRVPCASQLFGSECASGRTQAKTERWIQAEVYEKSRPFSLLHSTYVEFFPTPTNSLSGHQSGCPTIQSWC